MTKDELHAKLFALQMRYLGWAPYWVREGIAGLCMVPLLVALHVVGWPEWIACLVYTAGQIRYEVWASGPKASDIEWRWIGGLVVWSAWCAGWYLWRAWS